jgi:hypothetical protein
MSLSKTTVVAIQQAGEAVHRATVVVAGAVRDQAEHLVSAVASQPFEAEGDQAFANFKLLARLSQDLQALEGKLRTLYANASELANPALDVVNALPHSAKPNPAPFGKDGAEDAVVKPASGRSARAAAKPAKPMKAAAGRAGKSGEAATPAALTPNDRVLLQHLQSVLGTNAWTRLTGAAMAHGAGLPLGSVGVSLKRLVAAGAIQQGPKGSFKRSA